MIDANDIAKVKRYMPQELAKNANANIWIEIASLQVDRIYFGETYWLALAYFAAHLGTLATRENGDEVGSISSKSEGGISISYGANSSGGDDDLLQTIFGRYFLNLRNNLRPVPQLTGHFGGCH